MAGKKRADPPQPAQKNKKTNFFLNFLKKQPLARAGPPSWRVGSQATAGPNPTPAKKRWDGGQKAGWPVSTRSKNKKILKKPKN